MKIKALFILLAVMTCVGCGSQSTDANYTDQPDTDIPDTLGPDAVLHESIPHLFKSFITDALSGLD